MTAATPAYRLLTSVPNLAALAAINTGPINQGAMVLAGATLFRLDRTIATPDNGSTVIAPSAGPGRWLVVSAAGADLNGAFEQVYFHIWSGAAYAGNPFNWDLDFTDVLAAYGDNTNVVAQVDFMVYRTDSSDVQVTRGTWRWVYDTTLGEAGWYTEAAVSADPFTMPVDAASNPFLYENIGTEHVQFYQPTPPSFGVGRIQAQIVANEATLHNILARARVNVW
jgi:hypothetical protein